MIVSSVTLLGDDLNRVFAMARISAVCAQSKDSLIIYVTKGSLERGAMKSYLKD